MNTYQGKFYECGPPDEKYSPVYCQWTGCNTEIDPEQDSDYCDYHQKYYQEIKERDREIWRAENENYC